MNQSAGFSSLRFIEVCPIHIDLKTYKLSLKLKGFWTLYKIN